MGVVGVVNVGDVTGLDVGNTNGEIVGDATGGESELQLP